MSDAVHDKDTNGAKEFDVPIADSKEGDVVVHAGSNDLKPKDPPTVIDGDTIPVIANNPKPATGENVSKPEAVKLETPKPEVSKSLPLKESTDPAFDVEFESEEDDDKSLADDEVVKARQERFELGKDFYCFHCHKDRVNIACNLCPRSYHYKCLPNGSQVRKGENVDNWECPECIGALEGEEEREHSPTMSRISEDDFSLLLRFALGTIKQTAEPSFHHAVSDAAFPDYKEFIKHPMDFQSIDKNIRKHEYKSTASFLSDVKWIIHNCYIYNDANHPLTKNALYFWKVAKNEMAEVEVCPDCFRNFYLYPKSWFIELCEKPHSVAFARLKGHPYWPCKVVRVDVKKQEADCRFFGAHDRAWVSFDSVILLSEEYPWTKPKAHRSKLDAALNEQKLHIKKIQTKHPEINIYSEPKSPFNPLRPCLTDPVVPGSAAASVIPAKSATVATLKAESSTAGTKSTPIVFKSSTEKTEKRRPGRPPGSHNKATTMPVAPEISDEASTESEEPPLVIDTPPSNPRKRLTAAGRPGRRAASELTKPTTKPVQAKRSRVELSAKTSDRRESSEASSVSAVDEELSPQQPRRGRVNVAVTPVVPVSGGGAEKPKARVSISNNQQQASEVRVEPEMDLIDSKKDEKFQQEIEKLKKQIQEDRENHKKELKSIKESIEKALSIKNQAEKDSLGPTLIDIGKTLSIDIKRVLEETKRQQWCAGCLNRAIYFCCWNTSYCGYDCQSKHWPQHMNVCQQQHKRSSSHNNGGNNSTSGSAPNYTQRSSTVTTAEAVATNNNAAGVPTAPSTSAAPSAVPAHRNNGSVRTGTGNNERLSSGGGSSGTGATPAASGVIIASSAVESSEHA